MLEHWESKAESALMQIRSLNPFGDLWTLLEYYRKVRSQPLTFNIKSLLKSISA